MEAIDFRSDLPPPRMFMGPASDMAAMPMIAGHPNLRKLNTAASSLIKKLEAIAAMPVGVNITVHETSAPDRNEAARASLEALRSSVVILGGTRARIYERDLSRYLPHLAPKYINARRGALARMNEMRAVLAFFLGEEDDEKMGCDFVPLPPPSGTSAPSTMPDLG